MVTLIHRALLVDDERHDTRFAVCNGSCDDGAVAPAASVLSVLSAKLAFAGFCRISRTAQTP
jgi:hypothetical protein